jgi:hypothetical protein
LVVNTDYNKTAESISSSTSYYIQACGTNHKKEDGRTTYEDFYLLETSLCVYLDDDYDDDIKNT